VYVKVLFLILSRHLFLALLIVFMQVDLWNFVPVSNLHCYMPSLLKQSSEEGKFLLCTWGWLCGGGWDGRGMWNAWRRRERYTGSLIDNLKVRICMDNLGVDGRIMFKLIKKNNLGRLGLDSSGSGFWQLSWMSVPRLRIVGSIICRERFVFLMHI